MMVMGINRAEHWHDCPACKDHWRHPTWSCSLGPDAECPPCIEKATKKV